MRRPSPDFTTADATRKATTTNSTLEFAKPAKALPGSTVSVNTTVPTASSEEVSSGKAFTTTEKIAAAKTANRCQASRVSPGGIGANQILSAKTNARACLPRQPARIPLIRRILLPAQLRPDQTAPCP